MGTGALLEFETFNSSIAALTSILIFVKLLYDFYYRISCQRFYKIPSKYFESDITTVLIKLFLLLILLLSIKYSFFDAKSIYGVATTNVAKGVLIFTSLILLLYMHFNCYTRLSLFIKNNINAVFKGIIVYTLFFIWVEFNNCTCFRDCLILIYIIFFIITSLNLFFIGLKNISIYETLKYNESNYLVLSDKSNYKLCVKYEVEDLNNETCLKLYVKNYLLLSEDIVISEQDFNKNKKFKIEIIES